MIQTIVYISLMAIILSDFVLFGINISNIRKKVEIINNVQENNRMIISLINNTVRRSADILLPVEGETSTSSLAIDMSGTGQATTTISLAGSDLFLIIGSQPPIKLNQNVDVSNVSFINSAKPGDKDNIIAVITSRCGGDSQELFYEQTSETAISVRR